MSSKAFALLLQELRDGKTHTEMCIGMDELIAAVAVTGKAGSITLKIDVKPASKGTDVDKILILDKITTTLPKPERGSDFYWVTSDNELSRNHPKQTTLDLRAAPDGKPSTLKEALQ